MVTRIENSRYEWTQRMEKLAQKMMTREQRLASEKRAENHRIMAEAARRNALVDALTNADAIVASSLRKAEAEARAELATFAEKLTGRDPAYAVEWMNEGVFDAAVLASEAGGWAGFFESEKDGSKLDAFVQEIERRAQQLSADRPRSTSRTSNMKDEATRVLYCKWAFGHSFDGFKIDAASFRLYCGLQQFAVAVRRFRAGDVEGALEIVK